MVINGDLGGSGGFYAIIPPVNPTSDYCHPEFISGSIPNQVRDDIRSRQYLAKQDAKKFSNSFASLTGTQLSIFNCQF